VRDAAAPVSGNASEAAGEDRVHYVFRFADPEAREVCVVGSFNRWTVCDTRLKPEGDGTWTVSIDLPHGRYEYMFVVDGCWISDPAARRHVDDGFGRKNALLLL
jgi:1,4-alpha-glucan branching enzyme